MREKYAAERAACTGAKAQPADMKSANEVRRSKLGGYGVFAGRRYSKGDHVERCLSLNVDEDAGGLENYLFDIEDVKKKSMLLLGNGSIFNHSERANLDYEMATKRIVAFVASRDVEKGEELTINYGENWFEERGIKRKDRE